MKSTEELTEEITQITTKIDAEHPELQKFLSETPITVPSKPGEQVKREDLEKYLQTLRTILQRYEESQALK